METPRLTVIKGLLSLSECQHAIPPAPGTRVLDTVHCTPGYSQLGPCPLLFLPASFPPLLACVFTGCPQRSAEQEALRIEGCVPLAHLLPAMISTRTLDSHTFLLPHHSDTTELCDNPLSQPDMAPSETEHKNPTEAGHIVQTQASV